MLNRSARVRPARPALDIDPDHRPGRRLGAVLGYLAHSRRTARPAPGRRWSTRARPSHLAPPQRRPVRVVVVLGEHGDRSLPAMLRSRASAVLRFGLWSTAITRLAPVSSKVTGTRCARRHR